MLLELQNGRPVFQDFVNDPRNTDNAWIESAIFHYHDQRDIAFRWLEFTHTAMNEISYEWVGISQVIPVVAIHLVHLKRVCHGFACRLVVQTRCRLRPQ